MRHTKVMALMLAAQESNPLLGFLPLVWILPILFIGLKRKNAQRLERGETTIGKKLLNGRSLKFRSFNIRKETQFLDNRIKPDSKVVNIIFWLVVAFIVYIFLFDNSSSNPYDCPDSDPTQYSDYDC